MTMALGFDAVAVNVAIFVSHNNWAQSEVRTQLGSV
jgi:hypothetical protein